MINFYQFKEATTSKKIKFEEKFFGFFKVYIVIFLQKNHKKPYY
jgi:hypothetical protein